MKNRFATDTHPRCTCGGRVDRSLHAALSCAQLVDDPSARPDLYPTEEAQEAKRKELFDLIENLVVWENTTDESLLKRAHAEILASTDGKPPAILDPFAGVGQSRWRRSDSGWKRARPTSIPLLY